MELAFPIFASAWIADADARRFAEDVRDAIDATMTRKEAVAYLRLTSEAQLSEQLNCQKPLNVYRLVAMPDRFWDALLDRRATRRGGMYLPPHLTTLLRGAAFLGWKRGVIRMALPEGKERMSGW